MTDSNCIFCGIASKAIKASIVYEDNEVIAFDDINPCAPIHVVIIPKRHIGILSVFSDKDTELFGKIATAAGKIAAIKGITGSGYRMVTNCGKDAGQEVFHAHTHLLGGRKLSWPPG